MEATIYLWWQAVDYQRIMALNPAWKNYNVSCLLHFGECNPENSCVLIVISQTESGKLGEMVHLVCQIEVRIWENHTGPSEVTRGKLEQEIQLEMNFNHKNGLIPGLKVVLSVLLCALHPKSLIITMIECILAELLSGKFNMLRRLPVSRFPHY